MTTAAKFIVVTPEEINAVRSSGSMEKYLRAFNYGAKPSDRQQKIAEHVFNNVPLHDLGLEILAQSAPLPGSEPPKTNGHHGDELQKVAEVEAKDAPVSTTVIVEEKPVEPDDELETLRAEKAELEAKVARAEKVLADTLAESAEKVHAAKTEADKAFLETLAAKAHKRLVISEKDIRRAAEIQRRKLDEEARAEWPDEIGEAAGALTPVLPFNSDFLPRSIRPWAVDISERMGTPLDFSGIALIVALAGVTGRRVFVYPKEFDKEWKESICLSGGIIAGSGEIKTPTSKAILDPVNAVEAEFRRQFQKAMVEYKKELAAYEAAKKSDAPLPEPVKPVCRRIITNDTTPEAIHSLMEHNPEGLLYYRDELAGWVADMLKKGYESMKSIFLAAMNGNDYHTMDRIGRGEVTAIMCASVWGHFQPAILRNFLNMHRGVNEEDGTVQRFSLLIWPDSAKRNGVDRPSNQVAKSQVARVMSTIASMKEASITFHFDKEAQTIFDEWRIKHREKVNESEGPVCAHLSKYFGAVAKVAALYQLVDLVTDAPPSKGKAITLNTGAETEIIGPPDLSGNHLIDSVHLQMAIRLFQYLESHMHRVYHSIVALHEWAEEIIAEHILAGDLEDGFTVREIQRRRWAGLDDRTTAADSSTQIEFALENLEEKGWVRRQKPKPEDAGQTGPGRPTVKWEINPKLEAWANGGKKAGS